jgi:hypothetical protein
MEKVQVSLKCGAKVVEKVEKLLKNGFYTEGSCEKKYAQFNFSFNFVLSNPLKLEMVAY